jgi:glycosyltransferase involved in cell wall biosynthesis
MRYKASIIIPTYNSGKIIGYTLDSILKQQIGTNDIETIVVDDGSSDNTGKVVDRYHGQMNLKYIYQEDKGNRTGRARNIGIENAESEVLVFVDSGVILSSRCISEHIKIHDAHDQNCAVIGYVYGFDPYYDSIDELKKLIEEKAPDEVISHLKTYNIFLDMRDDDYKRLCYDLNSLPAPWAYFFTCNVSVSRKILNTTGVFDERFDLRWGVEDLDLGYRIYLNKGIFIVGKDAESIHFPHDERLDTHTKFAEEKINKEKFHEKHNSIETKLFLKSTIMELNAHLISHLKGYSSRIAT